MDERLPDWFPELLTERVRDELEHALAGAARLHAVSMSRTARLAALSLALRRAAGPILVVVPDEAAVRALTADLAALLPPEGPGLARLPALDADPYRALPVHPALAAERVRTLHRLAAGGPLAVVTPIAALLQPVPPAAEIAAWGEELTPGSDVDVDALARRVVAAGFRTVDVVTSPGDFARRGGLFDLWPPQEEAPLRVELWGDEIETIRSFDPSSQRTIARVERFRWLPAREAPLAADAADRLLDRLVGRARVVMEDAPATPEALPRLLEETLAGVEGAPRLYRQDLVPLTDLTGGRLVVWEPDAVLDALAARWDDLETAREEAEGDPLPEALELFEAPATLRAALAGAPLRLSELALAEPGDAEQMLALGGRPARTLVGRLEELPEFLRAESAGGRPVLLVEHAAGRLQRLEEILGDAGLPFRRCGEEENWPPGPGEIVLAAGRLGEGVDLDEGGALVLGEAELFGPEPPPPPPRRRRGGEAFLSDLRDLKEGDLVVHVDHGVARYDGLTLRPGSAEEMLALAYAGGDRLMVPVTRLDLIQKYSGGERSLVPLDKLGGPGWDRRRRRVRKEVEEIAKELLELYARRRTVRAERFESENEWQREFEAAFPHELTADQSSAWAEIRADLASGSPMDRLLCGDVGYGKTEIALRAAFTVAQRGAQVAVLVPTTVLAFQHLTTFRARMAAWPMRVEMVSRLVPAARVKRILEDVAEGKVDVLIGTHRLLGKDVAFRRLGLLVVDEEQRFGVRHKEKIKALALGVHVLAMSATPIPRTLQMSLAGARDLSVIETPPRNRLAIQTHVAPWSESTIGAALRNELRRGGQIYFIHPRVQTLARVAGELTALVPEARIRVAHGQMPEGELEKVMLEFIRGEAQILVATSIVENGLDIPRANTIVISDAHKFGLSQLYQMRGRVGRSDQRAYAYLVVPSRRELTGDARRRLAALVEFSELGAGFRIAALDLEIRGAGDFLGARQSGHIAAVGFELYVQMLEGAVASLKGSPHPAPPEPVALNLGIEAHLPPSFLPDPGQRLAVYKRLSAAESRDEIGALREETEDRFGRIPAVADQLFKLAELRLLAAAQGAVAIDWAGDGIAVRYGESPSLDTERLVELLRDDSGARMTPAGVLKLRVGDERADRIAAARLALARLARRAEEPSGGSAAG